MSINSPIPERLSDATLRRREQQAKKRRYQFIKGPLPMDWFEKAAQLPGQALSVGLLLWFLRGMRSEESWLSVTPKLLQRFGISRHTGIRALVELKEAGLIELDRQRGRAPRARVCLVAKSRSTA